MGDFSDDKNPLEMSFRQEAHWRRGITKDAVLAVLERVEREVIGDNGELNDRHYDPSEDRYTCVVCAGIYAQNELREEQRDLLSRLRRELEDE